MRRRLTILLLGVCLCGGLMDATATPKPAPLALKQPEKLDGAVLDGNGLLWAYSRESPDHLSRFNGTAWSDQAAPFPKEGSVPLELATMTDGSVACLWRLQDQKLGLSIHTADQATVLGITGGDIPTNPGDLEPPFADSKNRLWITGQFPRLYCADKNGGLRNVHTFQKEELADPEKVLNQYNSIHAVEDGRGRIWVWSDQHWCQHASLRAVHIFSEEKSDSYADFVTESGEKIDSRDIRCIAKANDKTMWISVWHRGLYKANIDTLKLTHVSNLPRSFVWDVHHLFVDGADLFAVELWPYSANSLWRFKNGEWSKIIPSISTRTSEKIARLPVKDGDIWVFSDAATWFLSKKGRLDQFSWHNGFPLDDCISMIQLPNRILFAIGMNHDIFCGPFHLPPKELSSQRIVEIQNEHGWVLDHQQNPWIIFKESPASLSQWVHGQWVRYAIPVATGEEIFDLIRVILTDAEGRIWVLPREDTQLLHVYDTHSNRWQNFRTLQDAFLTIKNPPHFFLNAQAVFSPQYSSDHRQIACRIPDSWPYFSYYNGSWWGKIDSYQVTGKQTFLEPPWFDKNNRLCVNAQDNGTWKLGDDGKWTKTSFERRKPESSWSQAIQGIRRPEVPEGCVTDNPSTIIKDNNGIFWLVWEGILYKAIAGHCVPVFEPGEASPFNSHKYFKQIHVDNQGNALILMSFPWRLIQIKPKFPPPHTQIAIMPKGAGAVRVHFYANSPSVTEYRWQIDEQGWKTTKESKLDLKGLPNGNHSLRVSVTDAELQSDAALATVTFSIHVNSKRQMARLIKLLSDPYYDRRKEAVEALALQPVRSKASLIKARQSANDDLKWWIDAALQRIGEGR